MKNKITKVLKWFIPNLEYKWYENPFMQMFSDFKNSIKFAFSTQSLCICSYLCIFIHLMCGRIPEALTSFAIGNGFATYIILKNIDGKYSSFIKKYMSENKLLNALKIFVLVLCSSLIILSLEKNTQSSSNKNADIPLIPNEEVGLLPSSTDDKELIIDKEKNYPSEPEDNSSLIIVDNPVLKSNEEIALEVIKGIWQNGEERKRLLTEAGYDYEVIQDIVNKFYSGKISLEESNNFSLKRTLNP